MPSGALLGASVFLAPAIESSIFRNTRFISQPRASMDCLRGGRVGWVGTVCLLLWRLQIGSLLDAIFGFGLIPGGACQSVVFSPPQHQNKEQPVKHGLGWGWRAPPPPCAQRAQSGGGGVGWGVTPHPVGPPPSSIKWRAPLRKLPIGSLSSGRIGCCGCIGAPRSTLAPPGQPWRSYVRRSPLPSPS